MTRSISAQCEDLRTEQQYLEPGPEVRSNVRAHFQNPVYQATEGRPQRARTSEVSTRSRVPTEKGPGPAGAADTLCRRQEEAGETGSLSPGLALSTGESRTLSKQAAEHVLNPSLDALNAQGTRGPPGGTGREGWTARCQRRGPPFFPFYSMYWGDAG